MRLPEAAHSFAITAQALPRRKLNSTRTIQTHALRLASRRQTVRSFVRTEKWRRFSRLISLKSLRWSSGVRLIAASGKPAVFQCLAPHRLSLLGQDSQALLVTSRPLGQVTPLYDPNDIRHPRSCKLRLTLLPPVPLFDLSKALFQPWHPFAPTCQAASSPETPSSDYRPCDVLDRLAWWVLRPSNLASRVAGDGIAWLVGLLPEVPSETIGAISSLASYFIGPVPAEHRPRTQDGRTHPLPRCHKLSRLCTQ